VKRTEIAVLGAPSTEALRLELSGCPSEDGLILELLHDDRQTGTLARVFDGRIGLGEVSVPVAVKLQRDIALSQEDRGSVAAKFDKERNVHRRLQASSADSLGNERIVRQLEVWGGTAEHEADSLEPCILCARARHGLAPRCPECSDPGAVLEELQLTDDRGLRCSRCHRQFWSTPKTRDAILEATLRRDPACRGCAFEHSPHLDGCLGSATFLSFFRNRVLLLERLDLDLEDYLRWRGDPAASGARKAAWQAFDAHRRLVQDRRDRLPGPSVAKVSDLLAVADLFSDIVAGVEHLHQSGVAHLDLKPANVCVRFRGADLEIKVIDLGLSDDPNTLAYLRQAEGALSLWTDYSAPEFRRPRSRPIGVDGRFREDACALDWPRPESATLELPCPGDLLFFEDRDLTPQRFRVVSTKPERDGCLEVQAEAEPQHRLWLGEAHAVSPFGPEARTRTGLAVVLEKHCGFPADIYSLGMLLVAVLVGRPEVGDFREALAGVFIELEELLRERPHLPSRALVQRLLSKSSKHLQVFHSYAHRLASYGVAQPLAEELLGIALRATLRGDSSAFYLADRGGDARDALRRLRTDLDAVRSALRSALTAAQAAVVREARLAVLDHLRGRLHDRATDMRPQVRSDLTGKLLYPALDLGAAGDEYCERELAYLSPMAHQPSSVLSRWERELTGPTEDDLAAERPHDFLIRYCRRVEPSDAAPSELLLRLQAMTEQAVRASQSTDPAQTEDRERMLRWMDEHQALATRLKSVEEFLRTFQDFETNLREKLLTPWDRALRMRRLIVFRRNAAHVPLSRSERAAIRDGDLATALEGLTTTIQESAEAHRQRGQAFDAALAKWRTWCAGHAWVESFRQLEIEAIRQRQVVQDRCAKWDEGWSEAVDNLRQHLNQITNVLDGYEPLLLSRTAPEEVSVRLRRTQRDALDMRAAVRAARWLEENWPRPSDCVEAVFALWQLGVSVAARADNRVPYRD
jgi:serine/threonine protein kinase